MIFEWMADPAAWAGLATLVLLEIVLGIDNLVFIAILASKPSRITSASDRPIIRAFSRW